MSFRGILAILILFGGGGILLISWGWSDYNDSHTASAEPSAVELTSLEEGGQLSNNHVRIGEHAACYYATVYSYKKKRFSSGPPDADTAVQECYYPIVNPSDPDVKKVQDLEQQYGSIEKVPDEVKIDAPKKFRVVVKTRRFSQIKDIPNTAIKVEPQVQGLILNRTRPLGSKERQLLQESFPEANLDNVLVLEDGRTPSSTAWCYTRIGLGVGTMVLGVLILGGLVLRARRGS